MDNPNEYDDEAFTQSSNDLIEATYGMWEAGASEEDILNAVKDALSQVSA